MAGNLHRPSGQHFINRRKVSPHIPLHTAKISNSRLSFRQISVNRPHPAGRPNQIVHAANQIIKKAYLRQLAQGIQLQTQINRQPPAILFPQSQNFLTVLRQRRRPHTITIRRAKAVTGKA